MAFCEDASPTGLRLRVVHPLRRGQVLHLSVPLPARFRQYDLTDASYRVYALVRHVRPGPGAAFVGAVFLGRQPPRASDETLPNELYLLPGDPVHERLGPLLAMRLEAEHAPGGVPVEERSVAEVHGPRLASVTCQRLPVTRGAILTVREVDGGFASRAEVSGIAIGADQAPRLQLTFLDQPLPGRLLPEPPQGAGAGPA
jgi:hypothetical protein